MPGLLLFLLFFRNLLCFNLSLFSLPQKHFIYTINHKAKTKKHQQRDELPKQHMPSNHLRFTQTLPTDPFAHVLPDFLLETRKYHVPGTFLYFCHSCFCVFISAALFIINFVKHNYIFMTEFLSGMRREIISLITFQLNCLCVCLFT